MAVFEKSALLQCKDAEGNTYLLYPITKLDCVDGAEDLLHFGAQELTDGEQAQARANIGSASAADIGDVSTLNTTEKSELVAAINELVAQIATLSGIEYIESTDTSNPVSIRDLASGTYVFYGRFKPHSTATSTLTFSSKLLVNVVKQSSASHVMVLYPVNNCIQYLKATDDSYERKNIYLNDLMASVGSLDDLNTTDQSSLVAAVNEVSAKASALPTVTTDNNGAFLRVVDGVWTAVNLTDVSTEGA